MKENDKILIAKSILRVTFIMITISLILKIMGLNFLEADVSSATLQHISNFLSSFQNEFIYTFMTLYIQAFIFFKLTCINNKKYIYHLASATIVIFTIAIQWVLYNYLPENILSLTYLFINFTNFIVFCILIDFERIRLTFKSNNPFIKILNLIKKPFLLSILIFLYQIIALFLRNITYIQVYNPIYNFLLNFDYLILLMLTYTLFLNKKASGNLSQNLQFYSLNFFDKKTGLEEIRSFFETIKSDKVNFDKLPKNEKVTLFIYLILFVFSELFNIGLIIFIATINHALIECLFIITSFIVVRNTFGAFHFDSAWKCWLVSNISFFILNKVSLGINISIVFPITLGILLAFVTSKFIYNNSNKKVYRGMTEIELKVITKNKKLNKFENSLLTDFYCNRCSITKLTQKYNYSQTAIVRFKKSALQKLEN